GNTATSPHTSRCHAVYWRTGYTGCGRICGGKRKSWESDGRAGRAALAGRRRATNRASFRRQVGRAASGPGETNQPGCASEGKGPRPDTVLSLSCPEEQKLRFQGRGPLRFAPWPFLAWSENAVGLSSRQQERQCRNALRSTWGIVRTREPCSTFHYG